jgi:hypothetical protein
VGDAIFAPGVACAEFFLELGGAVLEQFTFPGALGALRVAALADPFLGEGAEPGFEGFHAVSRFGWWLPDGLGPEHGVVVGIGEGLGGCAAGPPHERVTGLALAEQPPGFEGEGELGLGVVLAEAGLVVQDADEQVGTFPGLEGLVQGELGVEVLSVGGADDGRDEPGDIRSAAAAAPPRSTLESRRLR